MFSLNKIDGYEYLDLSKDILPNSIDNIYINNLSSLAGPEQLLNTLNQLVSYQGKVKIEDVFWPTLLKEYEININSLIELTKQKSIYNVMLLISTVKKDKAWRVNRLIIQNHSFVLEIERV